MYHTDSYSVLLVVLYSFVVKSMVKSVKSPFCVGETFRKSLVKRFHRASRLRICTERPERQGPEMSVFGTLVEIQKNPWLFDVFKVGSIIIIMRIVL